MRRCSLFMQSQAMLNLKIQGRFALIKSNHITNSTCAVVSEKLWQEIKELHVHISDMPC